MKILALDLGTSSARGLVLDSTCNPIPGALARRRVILDLGRDGAATLDGPTYLGQLVECLDELSANGHLDGVEVVAASAQWHTIVPVEAGGAPLGPVLTWLDTRPGPLPGAHGPMNEEDFHQRTGTWWHRLFWTVRLPWLRSRMAVTPARFTNLIGYLYGVLLEEAPMSVSHASGTGMLDLADGTWDAEACELAGVNPGDLPQLAPIGWDGRLRIEYGRRWPALRNARWLAPVGDGAAASVGSHCLDERCVAVTVGTSAAARLAQTMPVGRPLAPLPQGLWRYRVDHERVVTGAAYSNGGDLFAWANRELRLPKGKELEAALAAVAPGEGVWADPRLGGDRPPGHAPAGSGQLRGIGFRTTAVEILAGLMNGLCRQVAEDLEEIESTVPAPVQAVLGGGAVAASPWWRRAFAVALAPREVYHVTHPEVGAIGAALLAAGLPHECRTFERVDPSTLGEWRDGFTQWCS
ncbi:MAG TPA: FGGY family carbohydrate kinase [Micromonosporaceae bacterium]|nr:FGGY family carbohydrate kinase [Micromonosporaceae bacterium]